MHSLSIYLDAALVPEHWLSHAELCERVLATRLGQALSHCAVRSKFNEPAALPSATLLEQALAKAHGIDAAQLCAVSGIFDGQEPGTWRLDPVVFRLAIDHLVLGSQAEASLTQEQAKRLMNAVGPLFFELGGQLVCAKTNRWYWQSSKALQLSCSSPEVARGRNVEGYFPRGPDAPFWRKLLNEAQMTWFSHDANTDRERLGHSSINGLWLSGPVTVPKLSSFQTYLGDKEDLAQFLASACGVQFQAFDSKPINLDQIANASQVCVISRGLVEARQAGDAYAWISAFSQLANHLEPLLALATEKRATIEWHLFGEHTHTIALANTPSLMAWIKSVVSFSPRQASIAVLLDDSV